MLLAGRVALVTGGATGIGRDVALALAERGADVCIGYSRSGGEAASVAAQVAAHGVRAHAVRADLACEGAAMALVQACQRALGRLDILVNNAGTTTWVPWSDVGAIDDDTWNRILAVNLTAPFACARAASALMGEGSVIINVASMAGLRPRGSSIPYAVSKAGLIHLTRCLATALAPRIRVNAVAPGNVRTDWLTRTGYAGSGEHPADALAPALVTAAILRLVEADALTGEVVALESSLQA